MAWVKSESPGVKEVSDGQDGVLRKNSVKVRTGGASLGAQMVKNLPAMQETWVRSLDWENPLEKDMATHSNILA